MKCPYCQSELTFCMIWQFEELREFDCSNDKCSFFCFQESDDSWYKYGFTYEDWIITFESNRPRFRISKNSKVIIELPFLPNINPTNVSDRLPIFILFS